MLESKVTRQADICTSQHAKPFVAQLCLDATVVCLEPVVPHLGIHLSVYLSLCSHILVLCHNLKFLSFFNIL